MRQIPPYPLLDPTPHPVILLLQLTADLSSALSAIAGADGGPEFLKKAMDAGSGYQGGKQAETVKFHMYKNIEPSTKANYPKQGVTTKSWPKGGPEVWQPVKYTDQIAGFLSGKRVWWHNGFQQAVIDWLGGKDKVSLVQMGHRHTPS